MIGVWEVGGYIGSEAVGVLGCESENDGGVVLTICTAGVRAAFLSGAIDVASESTVCSVVCVVCVRFEAGCDPVETVRR